MLPGTDVGVPVGTPEPLPEALTATSVGDVASAGMWGLGGRVLLLLANLLATPFTIRLLGSSQYGLWALITTGVTWAVSADVGMGPATTKIGADYYAKGDARRESAVVWTALSVISFSTTAVAFALALFGEPILAGLLNVRAPVLGHALLALRFGCAIFILRAVAGIVDTPALIRLRWRQYTIINIVANFLATIGTPIALALVSGGLVTASVVALAASAMLAFGNFGLAVKFQPLVRRPHFDREVTRRLLGYGGILTASGIAYIPLTTAERFLLGANHSTTVVAYYTVATTLATTLMVLPEQLIGPLMPSLARLSTGGRTEELKALYKKALSFLYLVTTPAGILLALVVQPFFTLWAGPAYGVHSTGPFLVVIFGVWMASITLVPYAYLLAVGKAKLAAILQISEVVPYLVAAWFLTKYYGAMGAAIVWTVRYAVDSVIMFWLVRRSGGGMPMLPFSKRWLPSILAPVLLVAVVFESTQLTTGFLPRVGMGAVLVLTYVACVWSLVLTEGERLGLVNLIAQVRHKPPAQHRREAE